MYLRHLYPTPKSFAEDESERFVFGAHVSAVVSGMTPEGAIRLTISSSDLEKSLM